MTNNYLDTFNKYFEMIPATTHVLKIEVYKLRYQVYCIETGFLNSEKYPEGIEFDEYDQQSIHYLIRHRESGMYAATTRLILPDEENPEKLFPIELHSKIDNYAAIKQIPRNTLGEASRFCVSKEFKRRKNEFGTLTGINPELEVVFSEDERRTFPHITIGLLACLVKLCNENDINYFFAIMEPALIRLFSALGIFFMGIGPLVDYHGKRQPCIINVVEMLDGAALKNPNIWNMLTDNGNFRLNLSISNVPEIRNITKY